MIFMLKARKYVSKRNSNHEKKQVNRLIILNGKGWHYIAGKKLTALLRGITLKYHSDFYCLNCLQSFGTENKHKPHKNVCENKDFCDIVMLRCQNLINTINLIKSHLLFMQLLKRLADVKKVSKIYLEKK